jgi:NTE family protein
MDLFLRRFVPAVLAAVLLAGCGTLVPAPSGQASPPPGTAGATPAKSAAPKIALALGGGAARGFAHIGVIKALEAQGIVPDIIVGTSAGSLAGSLYGAGLNGFELQKIAMQMEESQVSDWSLPDRGLLKGEALQNFVNRAVGNRPLEKLDRLVAVVATDLQSGEQVVFRTGNTGMAVRASSCVPGVFQPVSINGRDYVDGGLVSPIPVRVARSLGADLVIAVDISAKPENGKTKNTFGVMLQTYAIMGHTIGRYELAEADVVIRPQLDGIAATDFQGRHLAVMEGEKAGTAALPEIRRRLALLAEAKRR